MFSQLPHPRIPKEESTFPRLAPGHHPLPRTMRLLSTERNADRSTPTPSTMLYHSTSQAKTDHWLIVEQMVALPEEMYASLKRQDALWMSEGSTTTRSQIFPSSPPEQWSPHSEALSLSSSTNMPTLDRERRFTHQPSLNGLPMTSTISRSKSREGYNASSPMTAISSPSA